MKTKWWRDDFKVGLMAIIGMVLLSVLLIRSSNWRFTTGGYDVRMRFDYVGGLLKNAPVHMYGVEIGKVTEIELSGDKVEVTAHLQTEMQIREGYSILIDLVGLVGEKYIEIINGPVGNPTTKDDPLKGVNPISVGHVLTKADEIAAKTIKTIDFVQKFIAKNEADIHAGASELKDFIREAIVSLNRTMNNVDSVLTKVDRLAESTEGDLGNAMSDLRTFTAGINKDRENLSALLQDAKGNLDQLMGSTTPVLEQSLGNFQKFSENLRDTTQKTGQHIDDLGDSLSQLMTQLEGITESGDDKLQKALDDFGKSTAALNEIADKIDGLVANIESGQGTLGKLMTDETSYQQIRDTVAASKRAAENVDDMAQNLDSKVRLVDNIGTIKGYEIRYNNSSESLQNLFTLSLTHSSPYSLTTGLSVREGKASYDLQMGRQFGDLTARAGSIRSAAGIGLDYWLFSDRVGVSVQAVDITNRHPQLDVDVAARLFGGLYFTFGAEDVTNSEIGFNFGLRGVSGNR